MTQGTNEEELEDFDQFYDHERLEMNKVLQKMMEHTGTARELGAFQREFRDRMAEIGFIARVDFYEDEAENHLRKEDRTQYPIASLLGRCDPVKVGEFDHDQMGHEVRSNMLKEKGRENVQTTQIAPGWSKSTKSGIILPD